MLAQELGGGLGGVLAGGAMRAAAGRAGRGLALSLDWFPSVELGFWFIGWGRSCSSGPTTASAAWSWADERVSGR